MNPIFAAQPTFSVAPPQLTQPSPSQSTQQTQQITYADDGTIQIGTQESGIKAISIQTDSVAVVVRDKPFMFVAMGGDDAESWMSMRLMCHWRQIQIATNISNTVLESGIAKLDKIAANVRDEYLNELTGEFLQLSNILVARALRSEDVEFIKSLSEIEKMKVLIVQDKLNGLDLLAKIAEIKKPEKTEKKPKTKKQKKNMAKFAQMLQENPPKKVKPKKSEKKSKSRKGG